MITSIETEILNKLRKATKEERRYFFSKVENFPYFCVYYFPEFYTYKIAPFQYLMYNDLDEMLNGSFQYLVWVMFRGSAKTSIVKMFIAYVIAYNLKKFINYDSFDKSNAEAALFDITVWLQTNIRLIEDFGYLYPKGFSSDEEKQMKKINEFITTGGIKVKAYSVGEPGRGRVFKNYRPDLVIFDDIETIKTVRSTAITIKIMDHISEMMTGISTNANVIFLGNLISESGVISDLIEKSSKSRNYHLRKIEIEMNGVITWADKFTRTNKEAHWLNISTPSSQRKISIESLKEDHGEMVFMREYMNAPASAGDLLFDRKINDRLRIFLEEPRDTISDFKIWDKYNPSHRYACGGDIAKGVGRDSCASVIIDFSTTPARVVATYENNEINPMLFAHEMKAQGNKFGECLLAPELNNQGYSTITELLHIYPNDKIYKSKKEVSIRGKPIEYGWEANSSTVPEIMFQLKQAVESGKLIIPDSGLLKEARFYKKGDMADPSHETTRHGDKLRACAIAWAMRNEAELSNEEIPNQSPPIKVSEYQNV